MNTQTTKLGTSHNQQDWIDELMVIADIICEFLVGICIGAIIGWLFGLCAGHLYVEHYQPVYFSDYSSLSEVSEWVYKPGIIAKEGAVIGAILGEIIVLAILIGAWRQKNRVKSEKKLYGRMNTSTKITLFSYSASAPYSHEFADT